MIQGYFLISAIGYGIIAAASSVVHLYIGRIICSLGVGKQLILSIFHVARIFLFDSNKLFRVSQFQKSTEYSSVTENEAVVKKYLYFSLVGNDPEEVQFIFTAFHLIGTGQ